MKVSPSRAGETKFARVGDEPGQEWRDPWSAEPVDGAAKRDENHAAEQADGQSEEVLGNIPRQQEGRRGGNPQRHERQPDVGDTEVDRQLPDRHEHEEDDHVGEDMRGPEKDEDHREDEQGARADGRAHVAAGPLVDFGDFLLAVLLFPFLAGFVSLDGIRGFA